MGNYNNIKQSSLNGEITQELFPYLWEYYEYIYNGPNKINNYNEFLQYFTNYINIPVLMPNNAILVPVQELIGKLPYIFKYLDTKHQ